VLTLQQLSEIMPHAGRRAATFIGPLNRAMQADGIDTNARAAAFLAQIAHESGELRWVREIASGEAYEGRVDLGNTEPGDGVAYKGRGLIQITGRANYRAVSDALDVDFLANPALMEIPVYAARVSTWYWKTRGLNKWADKGDFQTITRRINGGLNGFAERVAYWERAKQVLFVTS